MHSRRDLIEAHSFMTHRLRSALVRGEPDAPKPPLRRTPLGIVTGTAVGGLILAVVAALTALSILDSGADPAWRRPGTLIVEKETGTRFALIGDRLRPVLNRASARLLLGSTMSVATVGAKELRPLPRGGQVGIPGAPDTLPDPAADTDASWLVCATPTGTSVLVAASVRSDPAAALIRGPDGTLHLAVAGRRFALAAPWVPRAIGLDGVVPIPASAGWLDAVPAGPALGGLPVSRIGARGPVLDGRRTTVGQVFTVSSPGIADRHYLAVPGGLTPLTDTAIALALGDPRTAAAYGGAGARALPLSPTALATARTTGVPQWATGLPPLPRRDGLVGAARRVCARTPTGSEAGPVTVVAVPAGAVPGGTGPTAPELVRNRLTAERVSVPPGGGLLARALPGDDLYLVAENGARYPIADGGAAFALGLPPDRAVAVPARLLAALPTGPVLRVLRGGDAQT